MKIIGVMIAHQMKTNTRPFENHADLSRDNLFEPSRHSAQTHFHADTAILSMLLA